MRKHLAIVLMICMSVSLLMGCGGSGGGKNAGAQPEEEVQAETAQAEVQQADSQAEAEQEEVQTVEKQPLHSRVFKHELAGKDGCLFFQSDSFFIVYWEKGPSALF